MCWLFLSEGVETIERECGIIRNFGHKCNNGEFLGLGEGEVIYKLERELQGTSNECAGNLNEWKIIIIFSENLSRKFPASFESANHLVRM